MCDNPEHQHLASAIKSMSDALKETNQALLSNGQKLTTMAAQLTTIENRGCVKGEERAVALHERINRQNRLIALIGGLGAAIGAFANKIFGS